MILRLLDEDSSLQLGFFEKSEVCFIFCYLWLYLMQSLNFMNDKKSNYLGAVLQKVIGCYESHFHFHSKSPQYAMFPSGFPHPKLKAFHPLGLLYIFIGTVSQTNLCSIGLQNHLDSHPSPFARSASSHAYTTLPFSAIQPNEDHQPSSRPTFVSFAALDSMRHSLALPLHF